MEVSVSTVILRFVCFRTEQRIEILTGFRERLSSKGMFRVMMVMMGDDGDDGDDDGDDDDDGDVDGVELLMVGARKILRIFCCTPSVG